MIEGDAKITVNEKPFSMKKGSHFILPNTVKEFELAGDAEFIITHT